MLRSCLVLGKGALPLLFLLDSLPQFQIPFMENQREEALQLSYLLRVSLHSRTARIERGDIHMCRNHGVILL